MPIGYKYAERSADNYVNWAKIGTDMSKMIADENKIREDRKEAYNQATRKALDDLANAPMGENQDLNGVMAKASRDLTEYIKMQDKLFKQGRLKEMDYVHTRQNVTDGYRNLFGLTKEIQTDFASKMERYRKLDSSISEPEVMAMIESLGNIADSQIYINPMNGMVSVAKTKKEVINGKEVTTMDNDPSKMFAVNELRNYIKQKFDRFNTAVIDADVKNIGKKTISMLSQGTLTKIGSVISLTDATVMSKLNTDAEKSEVTNFKKFVTDTANIHVEGSPYEAQSILRDYVGSNPKTNKPYEIKLTNKFDPAEAAKNPDVIYLQKQSNGTLMPMLTDEQKKVARDFIEERIYTGIDQEQKIQATAYRPQPPQPSESATIREMNRKAAENLAENLARIITGTDDEAQNALGYLRAQTTPIFLQKSGSNLIAYDKAGNPIKFDLKAEKDPKQIIRRIISAVNPRPGEIEEDDVVDYGMKKMGTKMPTSAKNDLGYAWEGVDVTTDGLGDALTNLDSNIFEYKGALMADELNKQLKKFGITAENTGSYFNEKITLTKKDKDGTVITKDFPANAFTQGGALDTKNAIISWASPAP